MDFYAIIVILPITKDIIIVNLSIKWSLDMLTDLLVRTSTTLSRKWMYWVTVYGFQNNETVSQRHLKALTMHLKGKFPQKFNLCHLFTFMTLWNTKQDILRKVSVLCCWFNGNQCGSLLCVYVLGYTWHLTFKTIMRSESLHCTCMPSSGRWAIFAPCCYLAYLALSQSLCKWPHPELRE